MDVGILLMILLLTILQEAEAKSIELCKKEHRNCKWNGPQWICDVSSLYCNKFIACDEWTSINIIKVKYGTNYYVNLNCPHGCNGVLRYSQPYTISLIYLCNGQQVCELNQWNTYNYWRLRVNFDCKERTYHRYTRKINTTSVKPRTEATSILVPTKRPQAQQTTTSNKSANTVTESKTEENNAPDQFPVPPLAACVTAAIIVITIVLIVVVCINRRRVLNNNLRSHEGNSVRMQDVTNQAVERNTDYDGHYEGLGEQTEQEHFYQEANQRTFMMGSQNPYVNLQLNSISV